MHIIMHIPPTARINSGAESPNESDATHIMHIMPAVGVCVADVCRVCLLVSVAFSGPSFIGARQLPGLRSALLYRREAMVWVCPPL